MTDMIDKRIFGSGPLGWIPEVNPRIRHDNKVRTPEWMVNIDGVTTAASTTTGFEDYAELLGWFAESARESVGLVGNQLMTAGTIQHSDVVLKIQNFSYAANLEEKMNNGMNIATIIIVRLAFIEGADLKKLQEITFENCRIQALQHQMDFILATFRFLKKTNVITGYNQEGIAGNTATSTIDYEHDTSAIG